MLTPVDISNRVFKGGIGYDKKDVETFMSQLSSDYKDLYSSNIELKDKITTLNESLQHYRSIEDSMQKALTLSEKTAEETVNAANDKARQITNEAEIKAEAILVNAKAELQSTKDEIFLLQQQFTTFKQQFNKILDMQKKIMDSEVIGINLGDYEPSPEVYGGYFGSFGNGGLGGGLGSGTYVGANNDPGRERANQEPAFDRGSSLNMDPFADAANGGGRFSKQTGGAYNGSKKNANKSGTGEGLNMKDANYNKVKRPVAANVTNNPVASSNNTTKTQQTTNPSSVTKDDMLEAINAVKQAVEQSANTVKEATPNTEYVLYTEEEKSAKETARKPETHVAPQSAPQPTPVTETKTVPQPEPVAAPQPTPQPAPQPTPVTETRTVPQPEPVAVPQPTPQPAPQPTPITETKTVPQPESVVQVTPVPQPEPVVTPPTMTTPEPTVVQNTEGTLSGEVEDRAKESHMLDSDDNHETGFDFIAEDTGISSVASNIAVEEETYSGEIEDKVKESHMLDSDDNHETGFDFVMDEATISSIDNSMEEETYSGEVEDKVNESHMLDSEDNYDDNEFNFIVDDSVEEEIPTIFTSTVNMDSFNTNTTETDDDVLVGDVEDKAKPSNLIGNDDDENEGFNFV